MHSELNRKNRVAAVRPLRTHNVVRATLSSEIGRTKGQHVFAGGKVFVGPGVMR